MNIRKYIRENFELIDKKWVEDNEIVLGDYYLATTKHDVYNIPYKLIPADSVGIFLKNKEGNKAEITVYCIDEDLYEVVFEDTSEKPVKEEIFKAGPYTTRELYDFLNVLFLDYSVIEPRRIKENFDFFTQKEEIQEDTHKDIENDVKQIIQNCCKGKSRDILPKKWALDRNEVVLVFWFNYFENKKVMNLCNKIEQALYDELGIGISVCADTTAKLNWHNI